MSISKKINNFLFLNKKEFLFVFLFLLVFAVLFFTPSNITDIKAESQTFYSCNPTTMKCQADSTITSNGDNCSSNNESCGLACSSVGSQCHLYASPNAINLDNCAILGQPCNLFCNSTKNECDLSTNPGDNSGCNSNSYLKACPNSTSHLACDPIARKCTMQQGNSTNQNNCESVNEPCALSCGLEPSQCIFVASSGDDTDNCTALGQQCNFYCDSANQCALGVHSADNIGCNADNFLEKCPGKQKFYSCQNNTCQINTDPNATSDLNGCNADLEDHPCSHYSCQNNTCELDLSLTSDQDGCNASLEGETCPTTKSVCQGFYCVNVPASSKISGPSCTANAGQDGVISIGTSGTGCANYYCIPGTQSGCSLRTDVTADSAGYVNCNGGGGPDQQTCSSDTHGVCHTGSNGTWDACVPIINDPSSGANNSSECTAFGDPSVGVPGTGCEDYYCTNPQGTCNLITNDMSAKGLNTCGGPNSSCPKHNECNGYMCVSVVNTSTGDNSNQCTDPGNTNDIGAPGVGCGGYYCLGDNQNTCGEATNATAKSKTLSSCSFSNQGAFSSDCKMHNECVNGQCVKRPNQAGDDANACTKNVGAPGIGCGDYFCDGDTNTCSLLIYKNENNNSSNDISCSTDNGDLNDSSNPSACKFHDVCNGYACQEVPNELNEDNTNECNDPGNNNDVGPAGFGCANYYCLGDNQNTCGEATNTNAQSQGLTTCSSSKQGAFSSDCPEHSECVDGVNGVGEPQCVQRPNTQGNDTDTCYENVGPSGAGCADYYCDGNTNQCTLEDNFMGDGTLIPCDGGGGTKNQSLCDNATHTECVGFACVVRPDTLGGDNGDQCTDPGNQEDIGQPGIGCGDYYCSGASPNTCDLKNNDYASANSLTSCYDENDGKDQSQCDAAQHYECVAGYNGLPQCVERPDTPGNDTDTCTQDVGPDGVGCADYYCSNSDECALYANGSGQTSCDSDGNGTADQTMCEHLACSPNTFTCIWASGTDNIDPSCEDSSPGDDCGGQKCVGKECVGTSDTSQSCDPSSCGDCGEEGDTQDCGCNGNGTQTCQKDGSWSQCTKADCNQGGDMGTDCINSATGSSCQDVQNGGYDWCESGVNRCNPFSCDPAECGCNDNGVYDGNTDDCISPDTYCSSDTNLRTCNDASCNSGTCVESDCTDIDCTHFGGGSAGNAGTDLGQECIAIPSNCPSQGCTSMPTFLSKLPPCPVGCKPGKNPPQKGQEWADATVVGICGSGDACDTGVSFAPPSVSCPAETTVGHVFPCGADGTYSIEYVILPGQCDMVGASEGCMPVQMAMSPGHKCTPNGTPPSGTNVCLEGTCADDSLNQGADCGDDSDCSAGVCNNSNQCVPAGTPGATDVTCDASNNVTSDGYTLPNNESLDCIPTCDTETGQCVLGGDGAPCDPSKINSDGTDSDCVPHCSLESDTCVLGGGGAPCNPGNIDDTTGKDLDCQGTCNYASSQCVPPGIAGATPGAISCWPGESDLQTLANSACSTTCDTLTGQCVAGGGGAPCNVSNNSFGGNSDCSTCNSQGQCVNGGTGASCWIYNNDPNTGLNASCETCDTQTMQCGFGGSGFPCLWTGTAQCTTCNNQGQCAPGGTGIACDSTNNSSIGTNPACQTYCNNQYQCTLNGTGNPCNPADNSSDGTNTDCTMQCNSSFQCAPYGGGAACSDVYGGSSICNYTPTACNSQGQCVPGGTGSPCSSINNNPITGKNTDCTATCGPNQKCEQGGGGASCSPQNGGDNLCASLPTACNSSLQCVPGGTGGSCSVTAVNYCAELTPGCDLYGQCVPGGQSGSCDPQNDSTDGTNPACQTSCNSKGQCVLNGGGASCRVGDPNACKTNSPPAVDNLSARMGVCTGNIDDNAYLAWDYNDSSGYAEAGFSLIISKDSTFSDSSQTVFSYSGTNSNLVEIDVKPNGEVDNCNGASSTCYLNYNSTYYWEVQVENSNPNSQYNTSSFVNGGAFTTPTQPSPILNYSFVPANPDTKKPVSFTDSSQCWQNGEYAAGACSSYEWWFGDPNSADPNSQNYSSTADSTDQSPAYLYKSIGDKTVTQEVCDSSSECCILTEIIPVGVEAGGLPQYKEVSPFQ